MVCDIFLTRMKKRLSMIALGDQAESFIERTLYGALSPGYKVYCSNVVDAVGPGWWQIRFDDDHVEWFRRDDVVICSVTRRFI